MMCFKFGVSIWSMELLAYIVSIFKLTFFGVADEPSIDLMKVPLVLIVFTS
jgi:hypothetical protein